MGVIGIVVNQKNEKRHVMPKRLPTLDLDAERLYTIIYKRLGENTMRVRSALCSEAAALKIIAAKKHKTQLL